MSNALLSPRVQVRAGPDRPSPRGGRAIQHARITAAALEAVQEAGYARMTIAEVVRRARVSRKTFYEIFDDREQCFLIALEQVLADTRALAQAAYEAQSSWREGVRSALATLLDLFDEEPNLARLYVVESLAGAGRLLRRRMDVVDELARVLDRGRAARGGHDPPSVTAHALVGGSSTDACATTTQSP